MNAILLLSSGIDSPVAGQMMIKKGLDVIAVNFSTNKKNDEIVKKIAKQIGIKKLYIINHDIVLKEFIEHCKPSLRCILCKRAMFKVAEYIAEKENCQFIITGENLAQVASQTLDNIASTHHNIKFPILTPIIGNDKSDITKIAEKIGTYNLNLKYGTCCRAVPEKPATRSKIERIENEESRFDYKKAIKQSIDEAEFIVIS